MKKELIFIIINFRIRIKTVCRNWRQFWSTRRWILRRRSCLEIRRTVSEEQASRTCRIGEFWIASKLINFQRTAIANTVAVKEVEEPEKVFIPCHSNYFSIFFSILFLFYSFFLCKIKIRCKFCFFFTLKSDKISFF